MKNLSTGTGIGTDPNFLNGNLVDTQTLLNTTILQDIVQFFQKLKAKAGITENGLFDNEVNGYQTVEALDKRNDSIKGVFINLSKYIAYVGTAGATVDIPYNYSENIKHGKFNGFCCFRISSVETFQSFDIVATTAPDLITGKVLFSGTYELKAFNDKLTFTNISAGTIDLFSLTCNIQGHREF